MINLFTDKQLFPGFNTFNREITVNGKTVKGFDFNSKGYKRWMTIEQNFCLYLSQIKSIRENICLDLTMIFQTGLI